MKKKKKRGTIIDSVTDFGVSAANAAIGAGIGMVVAGPVGAVGGALAGTAIEKVIRVVGSEIKERYLSKSETRKIETVYDRAKAKIQSKIISGSELRKDNFFEETIDERSPSEEVLEATLFAAQRESEEKKLPYLANLYANILH